MAKGKGIENWTDVDYAQAAIDMLPGTVEEIAEFLTAQKIQSKWVGNKCPLDRWFTRWTDKPVEAGYRGIWVMGAPPISVPLHIRDYMQYVDA